MPKQSYQERLEKKRLAERERKAKIKQDPVRHQKLKDKTKEWYNKRKSEGKIIPISQMSSQERNKVRQQNRMRQRISRLKKKGAKLLVPKEEIIDNEEPSAVKDPLESDPTSTPNYGRKPPIPLLNDYEDTPLAMTSPINKTTPPLTSKPKSRDHARRFTRANKKVLCKNAITDAGPSNEYEISIEEENMSTVLSDSTESSLSKSDGDTTPELSPSNSKRKSRTRKSLGNLRRQRKRSLKGNRKGLKILHKRIKQLTILNDKYRKLLSKMKREMLTFISSDSDSSMPDEGNDETNGHLMDEKVDLVQPNDKLYSDGENSQICAGDIDLGINYEYKEEMPDEEEA